MKKARKGIYSLEDAARDTKTSLRCVHRAWEFAAKQARGMKRIKVNPALYLSTCILIKHLAKH